jgi:hypothetical protein
MDDFWSSNKTQNFTGAVVLVIVSSLSVYLLAQNAQQWTPQLTLISALFLLHITCYFIFTSEWALNSRKRLFVLLCIEIAAIASLYFLVSISFVAILGIVWIVQITETYPIRTTGWLLLGVVSLYTISQLIH